MDHTSDNYFFFFLISFNAFFPSVISRRFTLATSSEGGSS